MSDKILVDGEVFEKRRKDIDTANLRKVIIITNRSKYLFSNLIIIGSFMVLSFMFGYLVNVVVDRIILDISVLSFFIILVVGIIFGNESFESYYEYND